MIGIIDYGAGNTRSVINSLIRLNADYVLTDDSRIIKTVEKLILPGVGHAGAAMENLKKTGLVELILEWEKPFLGVCVGMQLMYESCEEGETLSLGIIPGRVKRFKKSQTKKIPHMGWNENTLINNIEDNLMKGCLEKETYFVHSYCGEINEYTVATCNYYEEFASYINRNNFHGLQFHPEKSGDVGQLILQNFLEI
jgi:glutamine amidotransferase